MTSGSFYEAVLGTLEPLVLKEGFLRVGQGTYRNDQPQTFLLVHLVEEQDRVMPRLSVGLPTITESGVVVSTDLHVLVSPERFFWYESKMGGQDGLDQLVRDFLALGLPWLRERASLSGLTRVFEERVREAKAPAERTWWRRLRGAGATRRPSPFDLKVLSHCYEHQGRTTEALDAWRRYLALLVRPGEADQARLARLELRLGGS